MMIKEFFSTLRAFLTAFRILFSRPFIWYLFIPILLLIFSFYGGDLMVTTLSDQLGERVRIYFDSIDFTTPMLEKTSMLFIKIAIKVVYIYLFLSFGGYILLALLSPFMSLIAEKTDRMVFLKKDKYRLSHFIHDVVRGLLITLRNFFLQIFLCLLLFFLSFVPMLGIVTPVIMFFLTAYFYGFSFVDYVVELRHYSFRDGIRFTNSHVGVIFALGIPFTIALTIPVVKVLICGYFALTAVIAATLVLKGASK